MKVNVILKSAVIFNTCLHLPLVALRIVANKAEDKVKLCSARVVQTGLRGRKYNLKEQSGLTKGAFSFPLDFKIQLLDCVMTPRDSK